MTIDTVLGFIALIATLLGLGATYLWPNKRWIGICAVVAGVAVFVWAGIVTATHSASTKTTPSASASSEPIHLPAPQPPMAVKREQLSRPVKLVFKESRLFTPSRKEMYTREVNAFYEYLVGVGYEIPKDCPPIGITQGNAPGQGYIEPGSIYDASIFITQSHIDDPKLILGQYALYVFRKLFTPLSSTNQFDTQASWIYARFYVSSFIGSYKTDKTSSFAYWTNGLWDVRQKYGKEFAGKLLFYTKQRWQPPDQQESFDRYFWTQLQIGLDVMENTPGEYRGPIFKTFEGRGLPREVNQPR